MESKFKTKIKVFDDGYAELYLPNGDRVASGSSEHCWDERMRWEEALKAPVQLKLF